MIKLDEKWLQENGKYKCPYCEKEYTKKGICTHIWRMHTEDGKTLSKRQDPNKGYKDGSRITWNKGLTKETDVRLKKTSDTYKNNLKSGKIKVYNKGKTLEDIHGYEKARNIREKLSLSMREAVIKNPNSYDKYNVSGRVKNITYNNIIVKGTWELEVAKYLDFHNIKWTNEIKEGFDYTFKDKQHLYFPDFYLIDFDCYIEVKGYERLKDKYKWKYFPHKLIILKVKEIKEIKNKVYDINLLR